ncbi:hypothetical protein C5E45_23825 [Nocardia nova]|uniref:Cutinase family protein n=1 Tax=Nocardia nova TaxID=37330 RepID=A0A2S6AKT7_9NOCA|nr:cutinase family protein [Nocardia nova]PPJ35838.1 hypothetical protein C5E45_23825 [Nocardia nova]
MVARALAITVAASIISLAAAAPAVASPGDISCPALYVLGVQGAGESATTSESLIDSGALADVMRPLVTADPARVQRAYVEYDSGSADVDGDHGKAYADALGASLTTLRRMASQFLTRCGSSSLAVVGYRQGAAAAAQFAREVGAGNSTVPAQRVAGVALLSDPSRSAGSPPFPGRPGQNSPDPVPDTTGEAVKGISPFTAGTGHGGGIAGSSDADGFGALAGRVADICTPGDLSCDTSNQTPIQQVVSHLADSAADAHGDPLRALASVTQALAFTAINTATAVINNDVAGDSLATLSYQPGKSISQRLAEASDPQAPVDVGAALHAVLRVGTIAFNSVMTVVRQVVTPQNLAEIAAAGLANPAAGLLLLGQKLVGALPDLVPPTTVIRLVGEAFDAVTQNVTDNTALIDTTATVKYSAALDDRSTYTNDSVSTDGASAARFVSDWFSAAAADIAAHRPTATTETTVSPTPTIPTSSTTTAPPTTSPDPTSSPTTE